MSRNVILGVVLAGLVVLPSVAEGQTGLALKVGGFLRVDPVSTTFQTIFQTNVETTRGITPGYDGRAYTGGWTTNGIVAYDFNASSWSVVAQDSTNSIAGAPYQPIVDNGALGGPGLVCVDGNGAPSPFTGRNLFTCDIRRGTIALDSVFSNTFTPMADLFADPRKPDQVIAVGWNTTDQNVIRIPICRQARNVTPQIVTTLKMPCTYDAVLLEDQRLYCWSASNSFVGFECVDLDRIASSQLIPVTGIPFSGTGYGAFWNDPHENPGRRVYGIFDGNDTLYDIDMSRNPAPATAIKTNSPIPTQTYITGRSIGDAELTSWRMGPGRRNFHLNFGAAHANQTFVLVPSLIGHGPSIGLPNGREFNFVPDLTTILAVHNILPGAVGKTVGTLDSRGEADIPFFHDLPFLSVFWKSVAMDKKNLIVNITPTIVVEHDQ